MSYQPIEIFESAPELQKIKQAALFLSINRGYGGYLSAQFFRMLGYPTCLVVEYDPAVKTLRFKPCDDAIKNRISVMNRTFKLPEIVRHTMAIPKTYYQTTTRYNVEQCEDGWWYTTDKQPIEKKQ